MQLENIFGGLKAKVAQAEDAAKSAVETACGQPVNPDGSLGDDPTPQDLQGIFDGLKDELEKAEHAAEAAIGQAKEGALGSIQAAEGSAAGELKDLVKPLAEDAALGILQGLADTSEELSKQLNSDSVKAKVKAAIDKALS